LHLSWQIRLRIRFFLIAALLGLAVGVFVLFPLNEFVYFKEYGSPGYSSGIGFATAQVSAALHGGRPKKTVVYGLAGMLLSLLAAGVFSSLAEREREIARLSSALEGDLRTLIARGESANLEFKSSFRWDLKENKLNRALEGVVLKTIAGYMNGDGGTLLIGVADDGNIVGLAHDYPTLKKPDRDGFEQALMTAIATKLGADACRSVQIVFHRIDGQEVCRVIVVPTRRPVYLREGDAPRLYVRTGVSTRELNVQEAVNYTSEHWPK